MRIEIPAVHIVSLWCMIDAGSEDMKFDACIMNPPWDKKLALPMLEKAVQEVVGKNKGAVVAIQPINTLQRNIHGHREKYRESIGRYLDGLVSVPVSHFKIHYNNDVAIMTFSKNGSYDWDLIYEMDESPKARKVFRKTKGLDTLNGYSKKKKAGKWFVNIPIRHGSFYNDIKTNAKANSGYYDLFDPALKASGAVLILGITLYFDTKREASNFVDSIFTSRYKYIVSLFKKTAANYLTRYPFMGDYMKEWDDEAFDAFFGWSREERDEIEGQMRPFMKKSGYNAMARRASIETRKRKNAANKARIKKMLGKGFPDDKIVDACKGRLSRSYTYKLIKELKNPSHMYEYKRDTQESQTEGPYVAAADHLTKEERKKLGAVYTPRELALKMARMINIPKGRQVKVLDPFCGKGNLVLAIIEAYPWINRDNIYGIDVDPEAIRHCKEIMPFGNFQVGNALTDPIYDARFWKKEPFETLKTPPYATIAEVANEVVPGNCSLESKIRYLRRWCRKHAVPFEYHGGKKYYKVTENIKLYMLQAFSECDSIRKLIN